ncbi:MAG: hypothetical protein R3F24_05320 [Gammaproteobacteria bacterium]
MEQLPGQLLSLFEAAGQPVSATWREEVLQAPARNVSKHGPCSSYYNQALRDMVAKRDAAVIARYRYVFED